MKTNPYTTAIQRIHAPTSAVDNALRFAVQKAVQNRSFLRSRRFAIAAAVVLLTISTMVLYGIFIAPASAVYLESRESVTVVLNSRGKVLSATNYPELSGRSAEEAVRAVAKDMLNSGALSADENTLILGVDRVSEPMLAKLTEIVEEFFTKSRFHGAIVSLPCTDSGAKAAVIDLLTRLDDSLTRERLQMLSAHALNLLLHKFRTDGVVLIGVPTESITHTFIPQQENNDRRIPTEQPQAAIPTAPQSSSTPSSVDSFPAQNAPQPTALTDATQTTQANAQGDSATEIQTTAPTEIPSAAVTEAPSEAEIPSLSVAVPYSDLMSPSLPDNAASPNDIEGRAIPFTAIQNSYQHRMNYSDVVPAVKKADIIAAGRKDSIVMMLTSYVDFVTLAGANADVSGIGDYVTRMAEENGIDEAFFRENALIMVFYISDTAYRFAIEEDAISEIKLSGDTAYVRLSRIIRPESPYTAPLFEYDVYRAVVSAKIKKSELKEIAHLRLIPEKHIE